MNTTYSIILVRGDIPVRHQVVQVAHAAQESGAAFGCPPENNLLIFKLGNKQSLSDWIKHLETKMRGISFEETGLVTGKTKFTMTESNQVKQTYETEIMGLTAWCSEPVSEEFKYLLTQLTLWN